jgi:hypothetical protein
VQGVQLGREELLVESSFSCSGLARRIEQSTPAAALGLAAAMLCEAMQSGGARLRGEVARGVCEGRDGGGAASLLLAVEWAPLGQAPGQGGLRRTG